MVCCARFWDKVWPFFQAVCRAVRGERYAPDLRGIAVHTFGDKVPFIKILYNQKEIAVGTFWGKIINHKTHAPSGNQMRESNPPDPGYKPGGTRYAYSGRIYAVRVFMVFKTHWCQNCPDKEFPTLLFASFGVGALPPPPEEAL